MKAPLTVPHDEGVDNPSRKDRDTLSASGSGSAPGAKRKRRTFTMKEKARLIEESLSPGYSQAQAAKKHGINQPTLCAILKQKEKILSVTQQTHSGSESLGSYRSHGKEQKLEQDLYDWFLKKHGQGLMMDRPLLRNQAEKMAKERGLETSMTFSRGWLARWRARFGIQNKQLHREAHADVSAALEWIKKTLPSLLSKYAPKDISTLKNVEKECFTQLSEGKTQSHTTDFFKK